MRQFLVIKGLVGFSDFVILHLSHNRSHHPPRKRPKGDRNLKIHPQRRTTKPQIHHTNPCRCRRLPISSSPLQPNEPQRSTHQTLLQLVLLIPHLPNLIRWQWRQAFIHHRTKRHLTLRIVDRLGDTPNPNLIRRHILKYNLLRLRSCCSHG